MKNSLAKLALWCLLKADENTKKIILQEAIKKLFCTIDADDVLKENLDGTINFDGKILDSSFRKELRTQAETIDKMFLWKILRKDIEYQLRRKMFEEARVDGDMVWGQLTTWLYDVMKTRIDRFRK